MPINVLNPTDENRKYTKIHTAAVILHNKKKYCQMYQQFPKKIPRADSSFAQQISIRCS